jgi:hypothetical protein
MIVISTSATNKKIFKKTLYSRYLHQRFCFWQKSLSTKANFGKKLAHTNEENTFKVAIFRQEVVM